MASEDTGEVTWEQEGNGNQVEGGSVVIQNSDIAQQDINNLSSSAPHTSGDTSSNADGATEDVGDYDPESVDLTPLPQQEQGQQINLKPSPQPATTAPKKRKTAGGFLVGDSDSEDDTSTPASNGPLNEQAQLPHSLPHSPIHPSTLTHEAQEAVSNMPPASQANNAPAVPVEASTGASNIAAPIPIDVARPPQDVVAALEERLKEEPRAAMDTWLELIAELRRRNDLDQLRAVYERFLTIFPQAVSIVPPFHICILCTNK